MLNFIVTFLMIVSIFYTFSGDSAALSNALLDSCGDAVSLCIGLAGTMGLWGGVMRVAEKCGITEKISRLVGKPLRLLFRGLDDESALNAASLNVTANLLGLGNAATPLGIKTMKLLAKNPENQRHTAMFVLLNTASVQVIPLTVCSMRAANGAADPWDCVLPAILTSLCALAVGIAVTYMIFGKSYSS